MFGSYLRSSPSAIWLVLPWTVTYVSYAYQSINICDPPWGNQAYCADNRFWVKTTITNYNLWTTDPANLKSQTCVGSEIWAKGIDYIHNDQWGVTWYTHATPLACTMHACTCLSCTWMFERGKILYVHVGYGEEQCSTCMGTRAKKEWSLLRRVCWQLGRYTKGTSTMYYHHLWHQDFEEVSGNHNSPLQQWHQHQQRKWHISCKSAGRRNECVSIMVQNMILYLKLCMIQQQRQS